MRIDHKVGPLARCNADLAVATLASAFRDYPILLWLNRSQDERARYARCLMRKALEYGLRYGAVFSDVSISGVSIWLPPGNTTMTFGRIVKSGYLYVPFTLGLTNAIRFISFNAAAEEIHKARLPGAHWYLLAIGVDPSLQHAGIGTALIEHGVQCADSQRLPCYLETHVESNIKYFEKHGFRLTEGRELFKGAPRNWSMVREARS